MKRQFIAAALLLACTLSAGAKDKEKPKKEEGYVFTPVKELAITPVKNQNRSGTCWSYSGIGFLESELLRMGKPETDLSEMFVVSHSYKDKANQYVRMHGVNNFAAGGSFYDVLYVLKNYGAIPQPAYTGLNYGEEMDVHGELDALSKAYVDAVIKNPNGKLSPVWKKGFNGIVDAYLGAVPEKFTYNGKEYTPKTFASELGLNADDYVSITSYNHHPFYEPFILEIQDNWRWATSYNVPINEMMEIVDNAINNGYSIAWGADVSEKGFTRDGIATVPDMKAIETSGSDQDKWVGLNPKEKNDEIAKLITKPCQELNITQEMRQEAYDNYQTTDDHGMQLYGIAKDQTGKKFYMVKNSWGTNNKNKGTWYVSEPYVAYKTMNYIVHKNAIPKNIADKLGIK